MATGGELFALGAFACALALALWLRHAPADHPLARALRAALRGRNPFAAKQKDDCDSAR